MKKTLFLSVALFMTGCMQTTPKHIGSIENTSNPKCCTNKISKETHSVNQLKKCGFPVSVRKTSTNIQGEM